MHIKKHISLKLYNKLKIFKMNCKVGSFRILPIVHKDKFSVRPIINCTDHFTSNLCLLVDFMLRSLVFKLSSYLKDSPQFLLDA